MTYKNFLKPCPICGTSQVSYEGTLNKIELLKCSICEFVYADLEDKYIENQYSECDENAVANYNQKIFGGMQ